MLDGLARRIPQNVMRRVPASGAWLMIVTNQVPDAWNRLARILL
jgi:hypothetical protein